MPFRRRRPLRLSERVRAAIWPRMGFRRLLRYLKLKLVRLSASPYSIAAGVAVGVGVSWTPFLGVHIIIAWSLVLFSEPILLLQLWAPLLPTR